MHPSVHQSKYDFLVNHFKPAVDYYFPKRSGGRSFKYHWLLQFLWLATVRKGMVVFAIIIMFVVLTAIYIAKLLLHGACETTRLHKPNTSTSYRIVGIN